MRLTRAFNIWRAAVGIASHIPNDDSNISDALWQTQLSLYCAKLSLLLPWLKASLPIVRQIRGLDTIFNQDVLATFIRCVGEVYKVRDFPQLWNRVSRV